MSMKNYLLSLLLSIPFLGISQTNDSWFKIEVQFDFYAPTESFVVVTQSGDTLVNHQPTTNYEFFESIVVCDSGDMTLSLFDNFGDGWQSAISNASVVISNSCQGVLLNLDVDSLGNFNQYDTVVNLLPCPPPVGGCTDPNASNYNPNAVFSDTSCLYDVHFTLNMNSYPDSFTTPYVAGEFNNWTNQHPMTDADGDNVWEVTIPIPPGPHQWKFMLDNWADQELPPNVGSNPYTDCFILSFGFTNRTLYVPFMPVTLDDYCWESCYDCGTILGCTDSTSNLYNPWATLDDGTCSPTTGPSSCGPGETVLEIQFTPDNYPSESSWILYDDNGAVFTASQGTYNGATPGVPVSQFVCVDTNVLLDIVLNDSYGDGLCGTCFGGTVDGDVKVYDCNGNVLWQLSDSVANSNFGYQYTSPQFNSGSSCGSGTNSSIAGCMNPFSTTYNPLATIDDGTCGPLRVVGCTDSSSFNYDPNANTSEVMTGNYTLEIYDGQSNGWGGTWLGIKQGDWLSPQYTMTQQDGNMISFDVPLNIYEPVNLYLFTTSQSATSIAQVGYVLYGPEGDTIVDVPYWGAITLQFPIVQTTTAQPTFGDVCIPTILGCTDTNSLNYDPLANTDDGTCVQIVYGCTNPLAFNYDSTANVDDGSCIATIVGCMDSTMFNYDPFANTSGTCIPYIYGCTDSTSFNYNPNANVDDGSCVPVVYGCTDVTAFNYDSTANTDDGTCIARVYGCTDSTALNYDPLANTDNGSCIAIVYGCMTPTSINYNPLANVNDGSCIPFIYGCTDSTSFNYNPLANTDDSSCVPIVLGCTTPTSINYDPLANTDDGSCVPYIYGCTDSTAFNYNPLANTDNGTCIAVVYGCTNPNSTNYNPSANVDDSTCIPIIYGCTDTTAFNYNPLANTDNGSCIARVYGCTNVNSTNYNPLANTDDGSCIPIIYGCTDTTAFNYNPLANTDNGSCIPKVYGCTNPASINYNPLANTDDNSCIPFIYGCTDSTSFNYNPLANTDDGTCVPFIYGCTDPNSFNYDPSANTNQVSATDLSNPCIPIVYGCTDSTAVNFDPNANVDNGTCITAIYGCTDPNAYNYNPNANVSDTTACLYDAGCIDGPGNPYWLNDPCYAWVIDVDEYCCTNSWDDDCQALYDYCAVGSGTVDIDELAFDNIVVFPNPTTGMLNIKTNLNITHTLYDFTGKVITENSSEDFIDITNLPNGVYFLSIKYGEKVFNKRIVKED